MKENLSEKLLKNIYDEQVKTNRFDRLKHLETDNELLRGYIERIESKLQALEKYLGIEHIKEVKYKKL